MFVTVQAVGGTALQHAPGSMVDIDTPNAPAVGLTLPNIPSPVDPALALRTLVAVSSILPEGSRFRRHAKERDYWCA